MSLSIPTNLASLALLLWFVIIRFKATRSLLDPGLLFSLNLIALYPLRSFVLLALGVDALPDFPGAEEMEALEVTGLLALLGTIGFVFGYSVSAPKYSLKILSNQTCLTETSVRSTCAVYFSAAVIGITYKILTGDYISYLIGENRLTALTQVANILTSMQWPALIAAWIGLFCGIRTPGFIALFSLINVVFIPYQFIQGSKTFLSLILVSIFLAYYWTRNRVPKLFLAASFAVVVTFIFPYVQSFRGEINENFGSIPQITDLRISIDERREDPIPSDPNLGRDWVDGLIGISARFGGTDHLYGLYTLVPSALDYKLGWDYLAVLVNVIPRAMWHDKPSFSRGAVYGDALGTITAVTPFPYGEAYWDFGSGGLAVMMAVWGAFLALFLRLFDFIYKQSRVPLFFGTYFLSQLYWSTGSETSIAMVLAGIPQHAVTMFVLYKCASWTVRHRS